MPGPGEPLWTAEDRDKAVAYEMTRAESCPNCGHRHEDWTDPKGAPHDPPLYEPIVKRCEGCAERARMQQRLQEEVLATYGTGPEAAGLVRAAMAGHFVVTVPFDPYRDKGGE